MSLENPEGIKVHESRPLNAETPPELLRENFVTPTGIFYVRCHGAIPEVYAEGYSMKVRGLVQHPLELSLERIKANFPKVDLVASLYCAGNRRNELMEVSDIPGKVPWEVGAAGTARWTGVPLRDVLEAAGLEDGAKHVAFTGLDPDEESGTGMHYGGSIPLDKALDENVILAYEMNGEPLAPRHGFPLRVVAGGYIGARSVKWLYEISVQNQPSDNYYQAVEYKLFPPHVTAETADYSKGKMLGDIPLNAVICSPPNDAKISEGSVNIKGYAISGGEQRVAKVEVSPDDGQTWIEATLEGEDLPVAWRFWNATLALKPGQHRITARAFDSASNTHPETVEEVWNFQGYANNAWHTVTIHVGA